MMSLARQFQLLWEYLPDDDGKPRTIGEVAKVVGVTEQSLLNVLHGRAIDPRLETVRGVCQCFGISLDYLSMTTETACLGYLMRCGKLGSAPELLQRIDMNARTLTPRMIRDVLAMLQWRLRGASG